jgi:phosphoketolase
MLCVHLNRVIKRDDLDMIYIIGPGHGGPSLVAHAYLEGTYSEAYPEISQDAEGMRKLFKQFSFPGGIPSHVAPETPGSIHEGGELGYALSNAYGAAFDNPDLIVACVVGDGEAETGPLATGWQGNKFLNPARDGCVMDVLSEHQCPGWLEGYLLTGRHGFFSSYEAFIHIIDSMFNQHAKWLKVCNHIPWRRPIASFNYFLSSRVWRQDYNGFSHQDPGFIDHVVNKKAEVIRVYLPPDANCLLSVTDHCRRSRNHVNVVVAGKQPAPQWLTMDQAIKHRTQCLCIWEWASNDKGCEPDVVIACRGDVPTLETLAAVELLRKHLPELKVRVVNVVNLMKLTSSTSPSTATTCRKSAAGSGG